jgi:tRNA(Ile)-lysidine synthase
VTLTAESLLPVLEPWRGAPHWRVGLSGGLDSCLLLSLLAELRQHTHQSSLPPLSAIHVDHQLHPDSGRWAAHCASFCETLGVPLDIRRVKVAVAGDGPEAAAREARYQAFTDCLGTGELLLLAHHLDDQVETFFLRLMRGAGTRGLAGMPQTRSLGSGHLLRPLLNYSRAELEHSARERGFEWVEDPSNAALDADRNFLRWQLLPGLASRWPGYRRSVVTSMESLADAELALAALDEGRLAEARAEAFGEPCLDLAVLGAESLTESVRLLRRWLESEGVSPPPRGQLLEFARQLADAAEDSQPALALSSGSLRRYRQRVYLVAEAADLPQDARLEPGKPLALAGLGELWVEPADSGLALPGSGGWDLGWRSGGERCRPVGRSQSQALKQLLQERAVPPWIRERLPLLYADDELAAVADLLVCEGHQAASGEAAYRVRWQPLRAVSD